MSTIDYEAIVHHCIKTGELWEDPEFPAVQSSVFYHQTPPFSFQWKRPHVSYFFEKRCNVSPPMVKYINILES